MPETSKEVPNEHAFYFFAFFHLSRERKYEGGPIPWASIKDYVGYYECSDFVAEIMFTVIEKMDETFMELRREKERKEAAQREREAAKK